MSEKQLENEYFNYYNIQKTRFWRFVAFAILLSGLVFYAVIIFSQNITGDSQYIAEIAIDGMIIDASEQAEKIRNLYADKDVKAVIIAVNSPGGTTYDSEILYDALRKVAEKKPVVTYMKNLAASGGYIVALAGERIFTAKNTITGSIGVLMQAPNAKKLLDSIGVSVTEIKSSPIKGEPDYFSDTPPEAIENLQAMVNDTNIWFANLVKERRKNINPNDFSGLTNGSVYTGQQAVNNKLVDAIGGQSDAKDYLIKHYKLEKNIKVTAFSLKDDEKESFISKLLNSTIGDFSTVIRNILPVSRNNVDGLLSLWHS